MIAPMSDPVPHRAEIVVDLAAIRHNVRILKDLVSVDGPVQLMAVVKADGYGHGMVEAAEAARDGGADWLGVATIDEALALRAAGDRGPLLCWLSAPGDDFAAAVDAGVEVTAYTVAELDEIAAVGDGIEIVHTLTRAQPEEWAGYSRRIDAELLREVAWPGADGAAAFVCGATTFVEAVADGLVGLGYDPRTVKTERYGGIGG